MNSDRAEQVSVPSTGLERHQIDRKDLHEVCADTTTVHHLLHRISSPLSSAPLISSLHSLAPLISSLLSSAPLIFSSHILIVSAPLHWFPPSSSSLLSLLHSSVSHGVLVTGGALLLLLLLLLLLPLCCISQPHQQQEQQQQQAVVTFDAAHSPSSSISCAHLIERNDSSISDTKAV